MFEFIEPTTRSEKALHVLIVTATSDLDDELRQALAGIPDRRSVLFTAPTYRQALDMAVARQPALVVVDIDRDVALITTFLRDLHQAVPAALIAAALPSAHREHVAEVQTGGLIELLRANVRDFLRRPISATELRVVLNRMSTVPVEPRRGVGGRVISVVSNKGGVGKSTLSVNAACALAQRHPERVLLVDTSLQLGICALMLDLPPTTTIVDAIREQDRLDETLLRQLTLAHSSGLRLLAAPADALDASEITDEALARILFLARRAFDYVIVDTFPMLDSIVMAILDASDLVFLVVQGTAPSVAGGARFLPVLEGLGFPTARQRVILSRSYKRFVGDLTRSDIESRLKRTIDVEVPYEKQILLSMNTGVPRVMSATRWSGFARAVKQITDIIDTASEQGWEPATEEAIEARLRIAPDRRSGLDRRVRDVGYAGGDRRSGLDRRVSVPASEGVELAL
jgi:pilus assembly protein CpaE